MTDARWEELLALGADTLAAVCFFWIYKREEAEFRRVKVRSMKDSSENQHRKASVRKLMV